MKAQAAIDFLASYGIALIIITAAIAIVYSISTSSQFLFSSSCSPAPGFSCDFYSLDANGILVFSTAQASGGPITVGGIACSSALNSANDIPAYGNIYVSSNSVYYPPSNSPDGLTMQSGESHTFYLYCYNTKGRASVSQLGTSFPGYIWMNYTIVPTGTRITQEVASANIRYT